MITVLGSINLDLGFAVPHLPGPGETVLGSGSTATPGGKGANQALAAARDGARVAMIGAVGRDAFATPALALLAAAGVDLAAVAVVNDPTGLAAIAVDPQGRNQILVASGANAAVRAAMLDGVDLAGQTLLMQMEIPVAETAAAIARGRATGARVILNLAPALALPEAALRQVDLLIANEVEIATLAPGDPIAAARAVRDRFGIDVVVTLGGEGLAAFTREGQAWRCDVLPITPVDTTAAGDTFAGVLAAALDRGLDLRQGLRRASAAAGLTCLKPGAQAAMPTAAEIDAACLRIDLPVPL